MKKAISILIAVAITATAWSKANRDENIVYDTTGNETLRMDIYRSDTATTEGRCLIFVFGGGFKNGSKRDSLNVEFCNKMAEKGMVVAAIDYRLGMKDAGKIGVSDTKPIERAIHLAVEDLCRATRFLINNCSTYNIDTKKIYISGSSAGAITVLQTDYERSNRTETVNRYLPEDFKYAGVISMAGAVFSHEGKPEYKTGASPTLFYHGTEDRLVIYNKIQFFNKGLFGTNSLVKIFRKNGYIHRVFRYQDYGHEIAESPMERNICQIADFIRNTYKIEWSDCSVMDNTIKRTNVGKASVNSFYNE